MEEITRILDRLRDGDTDAEHEAWQALYPEMIRLARAQRRRWEGNWTLGTRALAHEAWMKLFGDRPPEYADRRHFFRLVSRAIRQVLVNYAEARSAAKRGGDASDLTLDDAILDPGMPGADASDLVALHRALDRFQELDPRAAEIVQLRYFAGLTHEEIAQALDVSLATVGRDWAAARAWLSRELAGTDGAASVS